MIIYIKKDDVLKMIEEITEKYLEGIYEEDDARYVLYELQERLETEIKSVEENKNYHTIKIPEKHGRLIDADKIEYHFDVNENTAMEGCEFVTKCEVDRVPTILGKEK